jgi:hypothetical protein
MVGYPTLRIFLSFAINPVIAFGTPKSLCFRVVKRLPKGTDKRILSDELVMLKNKDSRANYPEAMRRVRALVSSAAGECLRLEILYFNL